MQFRMRAPGRHEDFNQYLGIKISLHAHAQSANQQVLMMELTDEQDPLFLFQLSCSEQDFHILKSEQQLLVDFQAFPQSFVELLNFCSS
jgi:predicted DCC family thiol-disulfide oxidoreductase YuxK